MTMDSTWRRQPWSAADLIFLGAFEFVLTGATAGELYDLARATDGTGNYTTRHVPFNVSYLSSTSRCRIRLLCCDQVVSKAFDRNGERACQESSDSPLLSDKSERRIQEVVRRFRNL